MAFWKQTALYGAVATLSGALGFWASQHWQPAAGPLAGAPGAVAQGIEGQAAPDFALPDLTGKPRSLSEWRGQWLLVNFWASWCAPCMVEIPVLIAAQGQFSARGLQVLGVAMDDPEVVKQTVTDKAFNYPTLVGDEAVMSAMERLGNSAGALPYTVLIAPDGTIKQSELGGIDAAKIESWVENYLPPAKSG